MSQRFAAVCLLLLSLVYEAAGGGSGLNVVVVVNSASPNSVELGNYYCERRLVPPQNLLRLYWTGGGVEWSKADFETVLLNPLLQLLHSRNNPQIDYVVLSMDIPYRVRQSGTNLTSGYNSTTAALFYGFKPDGLPLPDLPDSCTLPVESYNSYAGSELPFSAPASAPTNSFLTAMITAGSLAQAKAIVERGVASDGTFPFAPAILAKTTDPFRNVRFTTFDDAIFNTRLRGNYTLVRTNSDSPYGLSGILGYQTGLAQFNISPNTFVPGAIADSLTSFGGVLFEGWNDQTNLFGFLYAGASASSGTVVEPCNYLEKFPSPQIYFYQSRGFNVAEAYYQSVTNPYQNLIVGEPLAAPFARPPQGTWNNLPPNALLAGTTNLALEFNAGSPDQPIQQVDLFLDGLFHQMLTNVLPTPGDTLALTLHGHPVTYTIPSDASAASIIEALATLLNAPGTTNLTQTLATAHGDRLELQSLDLATPGSQLPFSTSQFPAQSSTVLWPPAGTFLDTSAAGTRGFTVSNSPSVGSYLQLAVTKTNGSTVTVALTNTVPGTTISSLAQGLVNLLNTSQSLQDAAGIFTEDFFPADYWYGLPYAQFSLSPRSAGWGAAQVQVVLSGSPDLLIEPAGQQRLEQNLTDLRPRAHLYVSTGFTNVPVVFALDTTALSDGFHELTAVAYEGSHARVQKSLSQSVRVQNTPLTGALATLFNGTNFYSRGVMEFLVTGSGGAITNIELFATGGLLSSAANQSAAQFNVPSASLGVGLHPFSALLTDGLGRQYRTAPVLIRLVGDEAAFPVSISAPYPTLSWSALPGRSYEVLTNSSLADPFQRAALLTASNAIVEWTDPAPAKTQRFYRIHTAN